jgi:hypothetical protein
MVVVEDLLQLLPDLKVVHLVRDPKDVVMSRLKMVSAHSRMAEMALRHGLDFGFGQSTRVAAQNTRNIAKGMPIESEIYCRDVMSDVQRFERISEKFSKSIVRVRYEDFARNPLGYTKELYEFLNIKMLKVISDWLTVSGRKDSVYKWTNSSYKGLLPVFHEVQHICSSMYSALYPDQPQFALNKKRLIFP